MFKTSQIFNNKIEEKIKNFQDNEFDLVFTMAVLMHIHNDSEWVFKEIYRITRNYLIIIENEKGVAMKNFPRNYKVIFEQFGMKEVASCDCESIQGLGNEYTARVFLANKSFNS